MERPLFRSMRPVRTLFTVAVLAVIIAILLPACGSRYNYPVAQRVDVVEEYHGTKVADPYRWLEDPDSDETMKWVEAQNEITHSFIATNPAREKIEKRLTKLWNYPKYSIPFKHGSRYFFFKNDGLQNQSVLYMQESLDAYPVVVIDPNTLSEDGTVSLSNQAYSEDGTLMTYGLSQSGSDQQILYVKNLNTMEDYDDKIDFCRFASIAWKHDNSGFYYNRFPDPATVPEEDRTNYNRVYWHVLDTPQSQDVLVHEDPGNKEYSFHPGITDDGKYLYLFVAHGTDDRNGLMYREVESDGEFIELLPLHEAKYHPIDNIGTTVYMNTDLDAPRGRVVAFDLNNPGKEHWKEIIPQQAEVLAWATMVNNQFVLAYMKDAHHIFKIHDKDGTFIREIELPTIGSIGGLSGEREDTEMFFGFTSFLFPSSAYRYDFKTKKVTLFRGSEIDFDPSGYEAKQVFFASKDGTKVPMFLVYKKGLELNGNNPTIVYGYGGFNVNITPYFSISRIIWMENGGIFAIVNLRGGGEYGEEWHQAGMLEKKQNVFDDFIAAAEWVIENKYTSTNKLAIMGGSNGGLLVAACMLQRPDLFGAVVARVPVTDMLRYHKFTVGRYWVPEYGNAEENPDHFEFLYAYSPLHNVKKGVAYPATLVTSADTDDRVVPMHAKKFVATLQAADAGKNPILLRVETKAGHGGGKPTTKIIDELSDIYSFLDRVLEVGM